MNEGLRPHHEIANNVSEAIPLKTTNPELDYEKLETVGIGGFGKVHKVRRLNDNKFFAMKVVKDVLEDEKQLVINEASLISFLNSDEMV